MIKEITQIHIKSQHILIVYRYRLATTIFPVSDTSPSEDHWSRTKSRRASTTAHSARLSMKLSKPFGTCSRRCIFAFLAKKKSRNRQEATGSPLNFPTAGPVWTVNILMYVTKQTQVIPTGATKVIIQSMSRVSLNRFHKQNDTYFVDLQKPSSITITDSSPSNAQVMANRAMVVCLQSRR